MDADMIIKQLGQEVEQVTERLTERSDGGFYILNKHKAAIFMYNKYYAGKAIDKLAQYETVEEEGRLAVLSCKVGDTVYVIENRHIEVFEVNKIELKPRVFGNVTYYFEKPSRRGCLYKYYDSELGDKWFIAREEAEKALKEMEGSL